MSAALVDGAAAGPVVSVVIPTRNRSTLLARTLDALDGQRDAPPFEIIVVDDGSTDGTPQMLAGRHQANLVVLHQPASRGPAAARNRGWQASSAPYICFTDDDCLPQPEWLARLSKEFGRADIVQGRTVPDPSLNESWGPFSHTVEVTSEAGFYETCNMAYRRTTLELSGGFDEDFLFPYGEDTELAWRVKGLGARTAFVPEAVVYHDVGPSDFLDYLRLLRRRAALVHLVRLHPEARSLFPARWYHKRTHPAAAAAGVAVTALMLRPASRLRWVVATGALAAYARVCVQTRRAPRRTRQWITVIPLALVADLAEVAILARASVAERTVFL